MRCLEFMKIVEILRLKEMKIFTYRDIADSVGCSKTTVGDILSTLVPDPNVVHLAST